MSEPALSRLETTVLTEDAVPDFADGDPFEGTDGEPSPRCMWDESVCTDTPTHFLSLLVTPDEAEAATFCGRHYVLTIHRAIAEHHGADHPWQAHVAGFGEL